MIPEPSNELYAAVKAVANPWPPDSEDAATQLAQTWHTAGTAATQTGTQVAAAAQAATSAWQDPAGTNFGTKLTSGAQTLQKLGEGATQVAGQAEKYAAALVDAKSTITRVIAQNLKLYLLFSSPAAGQSGPSPAATSLVTQIANELTAMIAAKAAGLAAAPPPPPPPPPPAAPADNNVLGKVGDVAAIVASVAGAAALIPVLTPFAAPIAAGAGGVALIAHGIDMVANHKLGDPNAWVSVGTDTVGLVPGVRAVGAVVNGAKDAVTGIDVAQHAADVGLQVPAAVGLVNDSPEAQLDKNIAGAGDLGVNVFGLVREFRK